MGETGTDSVGGLDDRPVWALSDAELAERIDELHALRQSITARWLQLVAEFDGRKLAATLGATSSTAWLRDRLRVSARTARADLRLAHRLQDLPVTAGALSDAEVNAEQAAAIERVMADLPTGLGPEMHAEVERAMLGFATDFGPPQLSHLGTTILRHVAPEVAEQHELADLEREEKRAWRDRGFTLAADGLGQVRVSGRLDNESAATVTAAIDSLCSPFADLHTAIRSGTDEDCAVADERTPAQQRADALVQVCRLALAGGTLPAHGGSRPQVMVTMPFEPWAEAITASTAPSTTAPSTTAPSTTAPSTTAPSTTAPSTTATTEKTAATAPTNRTAPTDRPEQTDQTDQTWRLAEQRGRPAERAGRLADGRLVTPHTLRRMCCDADLVPVVLGGDGVVLDVGRAHRLFTGPIRKALFVRDRGCQFPGCDRPASWCDAHHVVAWWRGGQTSLDNGVLLCRRHHVMVHEPGGWTIRLGGDRLPEFLPPPYIDPQQRPRRNQYWRRT